MYSPSINKLIQALKKLPGVGQRTAERYVFHLLKSGKKEVQGIALALRNLMDNVKSCEICWYFDDQSPCYIDRDKKRDHSAICVVAEPQDLQAIEATREYNGVYHVLRGVLTMDDEEAPQKLKIAELLGRVKKDGAKIHEVILALNPDLPGETTAMYLQKELKKINPRLKITRLARGLPMGSDLQYADEITLGSALKNRK